MGDSEKDPLNGSFKQRTEEDEVAEEAQEPEPAPDDDLAAEDDEPDSTETEDDEDELFAARAGSVRPAVRSGQRRTPGKHAQPSGGKASVFDFDGFQSFGVGGDFDLEIDGDMQPADLGQTHFHLAERMHQFIVGGFVGKIQ